MNLTINQRSLLKQALDAWGEHLKGVKRKAERVGQLLAAQNAEQDLIDLAEVQKQLSLHGDKVEAIAMPRGLMKASYSNPRNAGMGQGYTRPVRDAKIVEE